MTPATPSLRSRAPGNRGRARLGTAVARAWEPRSRAWADGLRLAIGWFLAENGSGVHARLPVDVAAWPTRIEAANAR
jgi:hypothetical protein